MEVVQYFRVNDPLCNHLEGVKQLSSVVDSTLSSSKVVVYNLKGEFSKIMLNSNLDIFIGPIYRDGKKNRKPSDS